MRLHKRVAYILSSVILSVSSMLVLVVPVAHAAADVCTWSGAGGNALMSNAGNWACSVDTLDLTGDSLVFPSDASAFTVVNDLSGLSVNGITFNGPLVDGTTCNTSSYVISGNSFALVGNVVSAHTGTCANGAYSQISAPIVFGSGSHLFNASGRASGVWSETLSLTGGLSGSAVVVARDIYLEVEQVDQTVSLSIEDNSYLNYKLASCSNAIDSPIVISGSVRFDINAQPTSCSDVTVTNMSLAANAELDALNQTVTTTNFTQAGYTYKVTDGSLTKWNVNGQTLEGAYVETTINTDQTGQTQSTYGKEKIIVNSPGIVGLVFVNNFGYLMGSGGTVGAVNVATGGILAPGNSPGCLNSGNLTLAGTYQAEIQGATACAGYDQMKVTGTVNLTGGTLSTTTSGFVPTAGQKFTIIDNDGSADAVTGTFTGLAEGVDVVNAGVTYTISYVGGDGNDVVLTVKSVNASAIPGAPNTGFALLSNNPLLTTLITLMAIAGLVVVARKQNQTN